MLLKVMSSQNNKNGCRIVWHFELPTFLRTGHCHCLSICWAQCSGTAALKPWEENSWLPLIPPPVWVEGKSPQALDENLFITHPNCQRFHPASADLYHSLVLRPVLNSDVFASRLSDMVGGNHEREEAFIFLFFFFGLRVNFKLFPERRGREGLSLSVFSSYPSWCRCFPAFLGFPFSFFGLCPLHLNFPCF